MRCLGLDGAVRKPNGLRMNSVDIKDLGFNGQSLNDKRERKEVEQAGETKRIYPRGLAMLSLLRGIALGGLKSVAGCCSASAAIES